MPKIAKCRITKSESMFDAPKIYVELDDGTPEHFLFDFYPDEIHFTEDELIGLTEEQARGLKFSKDSAYLRS